MPEGMVSKARTLPTMTQFRWVVVGLLFAIDLINYVDRTAISFGINEIAQQYHFDSQQVGLILGAFGIGYFVTTLTGGVVTDRFGTRRVLLIAATVWSLAMLASGLALGFLSLYAARLALGLAEGPNFPALERAVELWLPVHERARALSTALVGVPVALAIGAPIVTMLLSAFGWRGAFIVLGVVIVLWLPFFYFLFRNTPAQSRHINAAERSYIAADADALSPHGPNEHGFASRRQWKFILTNPTLLSNNWAFFVFGYFLFFFMTWLPDYLQHVYGLSLGAVGAFTFVPWALAAVLLWLAGRLGDHLYQRTHRLRVSISYVIIFSQLVAAIAVVPVAFVHSAGLAITLISVAVGFTLSGNAAYYQVPMVVAPSRPATALGVMNAGFAIAGFLAPTVTGYIVSATGDFRAAFWLLGILALSSVVATALFHRPDRSTRLGDDWSMASKL